MAAAVGEIAKDTQYQNIVNDNGDPISPHGAYRLEIISACSERVWGLCNRKVLQANHPWVGER